MSPDIHFGDLPEVALTLKVKRTILLQSVGGVLISLSLAVSL